ncbi:MAG: hypothetical protein HY540_04545 [Deltaproteobacteria bacterium]|nr:hypothetical protein [Deltaproteobacteria bacterium]
MLAASGNYSPPRIIGLLGDAPPDPKIEKALQRNLKLVSSEHILLSFEVQGKYLKNLATCLKLMDIEGILVHGKHGQKLLKLCDKIDEAAKKAKSVNVVGIKGKKLWGSYVDLETKDGQREAFGKIIKLNHR